MNVRIATKIEEGKLKLVEVRDNCWRCPNNRTPGYFDMFCRLTDEYLGDRMENTVPIPESCPLPSLLVISQNLWREKSNEEVSEPE